MHHLNYCRQMAMYAMSYLAIPNVDKATREYVTGLLDLSHASQKFIMPNGGRLLNDKHLRALDPSGALSLPFQFIALEIPHDGGNISDIPVNATHIPKQILFCREHDDLIKITPVYQRKHDGTWGGLATFALRRRGALKRDGDGFHFSLDFSDPCYGDETGLQGNAASLANTLLDFLNALACSNVKIERSPAQKQPKASKGALPFDDYHVLTINASKRAESGGADHTHRSPREHLRRGHIRRLETGSRIWVNATVVNPGVGGKVQKDYRVCA